MGRVEGYYMVRERQRVREQPEKPGECNDSQNMNPGDVGVDVLPNPSADHTLLPLTHSNCFDKQILPFLLLLLLLLEFLQVLLRHLNDAFGLVVGGEEGRGEGAGASVH